MMRWCTLYTGAPCSQIDVAAEMTGVTLDGLARTIFSDGLGGEAEQLRGAMSMYFEAIGQIDPLDLLGAPACIPRLSRWLAHPAMRFFDAAIDEISATRAGGRADRDAPEDLLTLLLNALDPGTGRRMTEAEAWSNILTFIAAGHETTANCLSWSLLLLTNCRTGTNRSWQKFIVNQSAQFPRWPIAWFSTRAVIDESLRLYPPIAAISRVARGPTNWPGLPLNAARWW